MMLPLQLRHDAGSGAPPAAWFLPGDAAAGWLEELARCGLASAETRLFVVPRSRADRAPVGLLVVPGQPDPLPAKPRGLACRVLVDRVYLPADSVVFPSVTEREMRDLCPLSLSFVHPVFGWSAFEPESSMRVWDLLESPTEVAEDWNGAHPGTPALPELQTIALARPPTIGDAFGSAKQEIGTQPPAQLPPAPNEPGEHALARSGRALRGLLTNLLTGALRHLPRTGGRRTWLNKLENWAQQQWQGLNQQLEHLRHKELHRLLSLFDTDPESALRHAIPMNDFAHRGLGPPGAKLPARVPDFDPGKLGGQAVDFWNVPVDLQQLLRSRYRDMANRELQLGRYRRAAYIYAELLGDLLSAARAFKQGRHFREAALLYEERLHNPLEAAHCLAAGGLLVEAIERFEKLGRWLDVANLQERLGNTAAARQAVRRVVDERLGQDDILGAAKLVEERLHDTEEALHLLFRAWPASRQSLACLAGAFQLLGRLGRHDQALERLARLVREPVPAALVLPLLDALSGPAREYPHQPVRHRAADFTRVLISRQLVQPALPPEIASQLMKLLVRLAPEDGLLTRDANRHLAARRESALRVPPVRPSPLSGRLPSVVHSFQLPRQMEWVSLCSRWRWFFAVGISANRLKLIRGSWEGELQSVAWVCAGTSKVSRLLCEPLDDHARVVALCIPGQPPFGDRRFPAADACFDAETLAGTPAWMQPYWPVAFGEDCTWTAHVGVGRAILSCHDRHGTLQRTIDVTEDLLQDAERSEQTHVCLAAVGPRAAVALGNRLVLVRADGRLQRMELPGQVTGLLPTLPHTRAGLAILLDRGAAIHWMGMPGWIELDRELPSPKAVFVPGGPLVLISEETLTLFEVDSSGVQEVTRVPLSGLPLIGITATDRPRQFAILRARGQMTVYQLGS